MAALGGIVPGDIFALRDAEFQWLVGAREAGCEQDEVSFALFYRRRLRPELNARA